LLMMMWRRVRALRRAAYMIGGSCQLGSSMKCKRRSRRRESCVELLLLLLLKRW